MTNQFILDVLKTFNPHEQQNLQLFLESPFFNRGVNASKLRELGVLLIEWQRQGHLESIERKTIYEKLFPGTREVPGKLDKFMSEFKKLLIKYLEIQQYENTENEGNRTIDLLTQLRNRGLEYRYRMTLEKLRKSIAADGKEDISTLYLTLKVALELHEWESTFNKGKGDLNIPQVIDSLDLYYYTLRTEMLNVLILQGKATILGGNSTALLQNYWSIPENLMEKSVLLKIYLKIYNLLHSENPDVGMFHEFHEFLKKQEERISHGHLVSSYVYLRNICNLMIENGHDELKKIYHQIQRDNLAQGFFYFEGKIPPSSFLQITLKALLANEIEWAHNFVDHHYNKIIGENEAHDFYRMNKALCLFSEGKFDEALQNIPFGLPYSFYSLMARRLELKIYYELDSDLLPFKIDAFKMFISRAGNKSLSQDFYELSLNFVNLLRQLSLIPRITNKTRSEKMIKRIREKKLVADRAWLLEKARQIGDKKR